MSFLIVSFSIFLRWSARSIAFLRRCKRRASVRCARRRFRSRPGVVRTARPKCRRPRDREAARDIRLGAASGCPCQHRFSPGPLPAAARSIATIAIDRSFSVASHNDFIPWGGHIVTQLSPSAALASMVTGYWVLAVGLCGGQAEPGGPREVGAPIGRATRRRHRHAAGRALSPAESVGERGRLSRGRTDRRFAMTPIAEPLRSDSPGSQRAFVIMGGEEHFRLLGRAVVFDPHRQDGLRQNLRRADFRLDGETSRAGRQFRSGDGRRPRPRDAGHARRLRFFAAIGTLADVGGGNGSVLRAVLARYPKIAACSAIWPDVVERARPLIAADGLADDCRSWSLTSSNPCRGPMPI